MTILTAFFNDTPETIRKAIDAASELRACKLNVEVTGTVNGKQAYVTGSAHEVMNAIGEIASQGHDSLLNVAKD